MGREKGRFVVVAGSNRVFREGLEVLRMPDMHSYHHEVL